MKPQIIERMLIDRALGELSPDVDALLEAYLDQEPAHGAAAAEISDSVALAKRALPMPSRVTLPPLKVSSVPAHVVKPQRSRALWLTGMAACFVLGLCLARTTLKPVESDQHELSAHVAPVSPVGTDSGKDAPAGFWSVRRLAALESQLPTPQPTRVQWQSPFRKPQVNN